MENPVIVKNLRIDDDHRYWLDNENIPGVNEVLYGVGIIDPAWYRPEHAYRGLYVHQATHYIDDGDYNLDECFPEFRGYLEAWIRAKQETGLKIIDIEQMRWHPSYLFAGRRDRLAIWNKDEYIIDIKTVGTVGAPGPRWAAETTAAYDLLEAPGIKPRKRASFLLYPDGTWRPELWTDFADRTFFLNYLATFRRLKFYGRIK